MYNKGTDKQYIDGTLIHCTIVISDSCTKFQYSRSSSYLEIFDENFHNHNIGEIEKGKNRKRRQK